jgi:PAS domain S-box-containing protein
MSHSVEYLNGNNNQVLKHITTGRRWENIWISLSIISLSTLFTFEIFSSADKEPLANHEIIILACILFVFIILLRARFLERTKVHHLVKELKKIEKLRDIVFDSANVGISFVDKDGRIRLANTWYTEKTGYSEYDLQNMSSIEITHPDHRKLFSEIMKKFYKGELTNYRVQKRYLRKDDSDFWGDISLSAIKLSNDDEIIVMAVTTDITDSINAENVISQKNIQLEKLIRERNSFISTLAHDLKSPFNSMLGFSDLLVENIRSYDMEKIENNIQIINYSIHQTFNLFNDIISWAKIQSNRLSFHPVNTDFSKLCSDTVKSLSLNAQNKKIKILQLYSEGNFIFADPDMIKSVLRNLISNSLKFTGTNGTIKIMCHKASDKGLSVNIKNYLTEKPAYIVISVSDTGIGIEPGRLEHLFDLSSEHISIGTANEVGTGLGLILCREFISKHNGKIWAESVQGKGSTFFFSIPTALANFNYPSEKSGISAKGTTS